MDIELSISSEFLKEYSSDQLNSFIDPPDHAESLLHLSRLLHSRDVFLRWGFDPSFHDLKKDGGVLYTLVNRWTQSAAEKVDDWDEFLQLILKEENSLKSKVVLHHFDKKKNDRLSRQTGVPIMNYVEFKEKWTSLSKEKSYHVSKDTESGLKDWKELGDYCFSTNTIIINDNYCLTYDIDIIQKNLLSLIETLSCKLDRSSKLMIIIIFKELYDFSKRKNFNKSLKIIYKKIESFLTEELSFQSLELALVKKSKSDNRFHDRFILTNTYAIKSGHSFNYFDLEGNFSLPSNTDLEIHPLFGFSEDTKNNRITYAKYYHQNLIELASIISDSQNKIPKDFNIEKSLKVTM